MLHRRKKKSVQLDQSQPNMSESSYSPQISDDVMNSVRVDVQNPVASPLKNKNNQGKKGRKLGVQNEKHHQGLQFVAFRWILLYTI